MVNDPISDFLIRIQNAQRARKDSVSIPSSKMTRALSDVLAREGYVGAVEDKTKKTRSLSISLVYKNGLPSIQGAKRISKPSRRMYMGVRDIKLVKRGKGLIVLSTPAGIVTGRQAREQRVGGEALFEIW